MWGTRKSARHGPATGSRRTPIRVHRINAATSERSAGAKTNCPNDGVEQETPNEAKKNSQNVKHFSLKDFAGFLPISKIRRRLSLDSSLTAVTENDSSSAPDRNSLTTFAILPPAIGRTRVAPWGSLAAARRNFNFRLPTFTVPLNQVRREVAFTNPMRCPARII